MSYMSHVTDPIQDYVLSQMPAEIKDLISTAKIDLNNGPVYLDDENNTCSPFDIGARRFDFAGACDKIRDFFDDIGCLYVDEDGFVHDREPEATIEMENPDDPDSEEEIEVYYSPTPYWEVSTRQIIALFCGSLSEYI